MKLIKVLISLILFLAINGAHAEAPSALGHFQVGIREFNAGRLTNAETEFASALRLDPRNTGILTNLGIISAKLGDYGKSIGYLRSALSIDPTYQEAELALLYAKAQLEVKEIPHKLSLWQTFQSNLVEKVNPELLMALIAIITLLFSLRIIDLIKAKKRALAQEMAPPSASIIIWFSGFSLCLLLIIGIAKLIERTELRGIVMPKKAAALSAPDEGAVELFEIYQGLEVIIQKESDGWVQVTYPGGQTGWMQKAQLFLISK